MAATKAYATLQSNVQKCNSAFITLQILLFYISDFYKNRLLLHFILWERIAEHETLGITNS